MHRRRGALRRGPPGSGGGLKLGVDFRLNAINLL
jgi:hypothetical protein